MAATKTIVVPKHGVGKVKRAIYEITADASYPTGGYPVSFPFKSVRAVNLSGLSGAKQGYLPVWDKANSKLMVFQGDNANAAAAPASQVPNATDLTGLKFVADVTGIGG